MKLVLVVCLFLSLSSSASCATVDVHDLSIGGVGSGVVAIIAFLIVGVLICIYGRCTSQPYIFAILGTLLPVIVALIIWGLPKQAERPKSTGGENEPTSWIPVLRWFFCTFTYLMAVVALFCLFLLFCMKPYEAYRVGADASTMMTRETEVQWANIKETMMKNRMKYQEKPEVGHTERAKSRLAYPGNLTVPELAPAMGPVDDDQVDEDIQWKNRRRQDILQKPVEQDRLLGPEGDIRNTGKNQLRPRRLQPMERHLEMGIEIHTPPKKRRLNMIDPEQRSIKIDSINVQGHRRMMDSDEDD